MGRAGDFLSEGVEDKNTIGGLVYVFHFAYGGLSVLSVLFPDWDTERIHPKSYSLIQRDIQFTPGFGQIVIFGIKLIDETLNSGQLALGERVMLCISHPIRPSSG